MNKPKDKYLTAKQEELHCLNTIHKNLEFLKLIYSNGELKDEKRLYYTNVGITNCKFEKKRVKKDIKDYENTKQ